MIKWPNGARCLVLLTFDLDAETLWFSRNPNSWDSVQCRSRGSYGPREGVPRILDLLDKYEIKSTFFIPGWVIENHENTVSNIHHRGHEVAYHGYLHEFDKDISYEEESVLLEKCERLIKNITGVNPVGHRTPMLEILPHTIQLLYDRGYKYSSNMMDTDYPYFHKLNGKEIPLVEFPTDWMLDDSSHYFFTLQEPVRRGIATGSTVFEIWKDEFDALYEEGKMLNLIIHPQISGRASRVKTLDKLIQYMKTKEGTWFARADEAANYLLGQE